MLYNDRPFRFWCHRILPLVYDESLSYYELLCKVVAYLNHMLEDVSQLADDVEELTRLYHELKDYVDNYFENLDVQDEINHKLDEMAEDGTLDRLLGAYVRNFTKMIMCVSTYRGDIRTDSHDYCLAVSTDGGKTFMEMRDSDNFGDFFMGSDCSTNKVADGYLFLATGAQIKDGQYCDFNMLFTKDFEHYVKAQPDYGFLELTLSMISDSTWMVGSPQIVESNGKYYLMMTVQTGNRSTGEDPYGYTYYEYPVWLYACEVEFETDGYDFSMNKVGELFRLDVTGRTSIMDGHGVELNGKFYLFYKDRVDLTVHLAKADSILGSFEDVEKCVFEQIYLEACYMTKLNDYEALLYCTSYLSGVTGNQVTQLYGYFDSKTERIIYLGEPVRANCHHFYDNYQRGNAIDCGMRNPYPIVVDSDLYLLLKEKFNVPTNIPTIRDEDIPFRYQSNPGTTSIERASKYIYDEYGKYMRAFPWVYYYFGHDEDNMYIQGDFQFLVGANLSPTFVFPGNVSRGITTGSTGERFKSEKYSIIPMGTLFRQHRETLECGLGFDVTQNIYTLSVTIRGILTSAVEDGDVIGTKPSFISSNLYWMILPVNDYDGTSLGSIDIVEGGNIIYHGTDLAIGQRVYASGTQVTR